ncbi:MAG: hypothetical protein PWR13_1346, partial [Archaeoglobi archaeon]|nr:hypothetical protein [Archaeoglobi archaeon]
LQPVEESFTHEVEYEVSISFREISEIEQTNVTLLIPFPAVRGDVIEPRNMSVPEDEAHTGWN